MSKDIQTKLRLMLASASLYRSKKRISTATMMLLLRQRPRVMILVPLKKNMRPFVKIQESRHYLNLGIQPVNIILWPNKLIIWSIISAFSFDISFDRYLKNHKINSFVGTCINEPSAAAKYHFLTCLIRWFTSNWVLWHRFGTGALLISR